MSEDLRVKRTKKLLFHSLYTLLQKMSFEKMSVIDICEEAMLHRATFYKYFYGKDELVYLFVDDILEKIFDDLYSHEYSSDKQLFVCIFQRALNYIEKEKDGFVKIINNNNIDKIQIFFLSYCRKNNQRILEKVKNNIEYKIPKNVMLDFLAGGLINLVISWAKKNFNVPKEKLLQYFDAIIDENNFMI